MIEISELTISLYEQHPIDLDPSKILDVQRAPNGRFRVFYYEFGDESYECGYEKADGERCEMNVESPERLCHHHS